MIKELITISKYKGLTHIYPKDIRSMQVLAKSGAITRESFNALGISDTRIKNYEKSLITSVSYPEKYGNKSQNCYVLTDTGKTFCKQEADTHNFISNGNSSAHNTTVANYLVNNLTKTELDSCLSERELKGLIQDRLLEYRDHGQEDRFQELLDSWKSGQLSMPDIVYTNSLGQTIALEVITDAYGKEEIETKQETCALLGIEIIFIPAT